MQVNPCDLSEFSESERNVLSEYDLGVLEPEVFALALRIDVEGAGHGDLGVHLWIILGITVIACPYEFDTRGTAGGRVLDKAGIVAVLDELSTATEEAESSILLPEQAARDRINADIIKRQMIFIMGTLRCKEVKKGSFI